MFAVFDVLHIISYEYIKKTSYKERIIMIYNYITHKNNIRSADYPFFDDLFRDIAQRKQLMYYESYYYPQNNSVNTRVINMEIKVIKYIMYQHQLDFLTDYNIDYVISSPNYGSQISLLDLMIKKKYCFKMVFGALGDMVNKYGPVANYERKASENFEMFKPVYDVLAKNKGDLKEHLSDFTRKGNMYSKGNVKIFLYTDSQKQNFCDIIKLKCKDNCYMANNKDFNCGRTFVVAIVGDSKMFIFSPDYNQPNPLQIPKDLVVSELKKQLSK